MTDLKPMSNGSSEPLNNDAGFPTPHAQPKVAEPIAIIGMSARFPQEATSVEAFWRMIIAGKTARTEVPQDRYNVSSFYSEKVAKTGMINAKTGHFIKGDIAAFDAPFFSLTPAEVTCMDPLQRMLLETSYQALENAGLTLDQMKGSRTSVFIGSFEDEYSMVMKRDTQIPQKYIAPGTAVSMLANRLSWFYDLRGPSIALDTACSSSLVAFHLACQSLRSGETEMGIVGGCNLTYNPESSMSLSHLGFLSPDGICYSFDERANGYSRGEGFGIVILKSLSAAIRDGDTIRAVVRATASNQDGRTPSIVQPSMMAQQTLIEEAYRDFGLDMGKTAYVEAHGTGTAIGDPIEATALGNAFKDSRAPTLPHLYIGALKSNIGHLEGASGVASVIKTVLSLERGIIPPNIWFQNLNKRIPAEKLKLKFPTEAVAWPTSDLRRASINSFGFGGANAHVVLDDAHNFLQERHLIAKHATAVTVPTDPDMLGTEDRTSMRDISDETTNTALKKLFVVSAPDERGLKRLVNIYRDDLPLNCDLDYLTDLAYTLSEKRTQFPWRHYLIASSSAELKNSLSIERNFYRSNQQPRLCFVFTGQGAQWYAMGRELLECSQFKETLCEFDTELRKLGCQWSVIDELLKDETTTKVDDPAYSQPICTALQIALVQQLAAWSIRPNVVIGHSSGEIAAAYCTGALSLQSACKVAYFRGFVAASLDTSTPGAMLAVGLSEIEIKRFMHQTDATQEQITLACINSPKSITLSGSRASIDKIQAVLEKEKVFFRRLPGHVAYHSPQMEEVAQLYRDLLTDICLGSSISEGLIMISSLTGKTVTVESTSQATYWLENLISPVKFSQALSNLETTSVKKLRGSSNVGKSSLLVSDFLEIGPHSTLKSALKDSVLSKPGQTFFSYTSLIIRGISAYDTVAQALGYLWCHGHSVNIGQFNDSTSKVANQQHKMLTNLTGYPFDHSKKYWTESRVSRSFRFRQTPPLPVLGTRVADWSSLEPKWRNVITLADNGWIKDHNVEGSDIYPAAGLLVMAMEAVYQLSDEKGTIQGYHFQDVSIMKAVTFSADNGADLQFSLRPDRELSRGFLNWSRFRVCLYEDTRCSEICSGLIAIENHRTPSNSLHRRGYKHTAELHEKCCREISENCKLPISSGAFYSLLKDYGLSFGPTFRSLTNMRFNDQGESVGTVDLKKWSAIHAKGKLESDILHPAALDAFLQLIFLALTKGGRETLPTMVPTRFRNIWISASIANVSTAEPRHGELTSSVNIHTKAELRGFRDAHASIIGQDALNGKIVFNGEFDVTGTGNINCLDTSQPETSRKLCHQIEWKPDIELLQASEIYSYCASKSEFKPLYTKMDHDKRLLCHLALSELLEEIKDDTQLSKDKPHLQKYLRWAEQTVRKSLSKPKSEDGITPSRLEELRRTVASNDPHGKLIVKVIQRLRSIMKGEIEALEVIFEDNLVNDFYASLYQISSGLDDSLQYVDLLAHKLSNMRILEIGAGTGSATAKVLRALTKGVSPTATHRFQEYAFTDISTTFFEAAKNQFGDYAHIMSYRALNIEKDPVDQGFDREGYDLIIASNVIHATASLKDTLDNVKKLMKPGATLILYELTIPDQLEVGFIFGLLSGWWLSTEKHREWSPIITGDSWDKYLKSSGFTGVDLAFPAYDETATCRSMVSTLLPSHPTTQAPMAIILINPDNSKQQEASYHLEIALKKIFSTCTIMSIDEIKNINSDDTICVSLLEIHSSFFSQISAPNFEALKALFMRFKPIFWASAESSSIANPLTDMTTGFARSLREENDALKLVTVKLQTTQDLPQSMNQLSRVVERATRLSMEDKEIEFSEVNRAMCIGRLVELDNINDFVARKTISQGPKLRKLRDGVSKPIKLGIQNPGLLSTFQFEVDDSTLTEPLGQDQVDIEVKAAGLNFRDVLIALGKEPSPYMGMECAGIVLAAGSNAATRFRPGDRITCMINGGFRTIARCPYQVAIKIPDSLSFTSAAAFPVAYCSAYYAIMEVGRLKPKESILIHSGAGAFGQACIHLAKLFDAKIFSTVGNDEKKQFLVDTLGIPEENIFSSRGPDFVHGVKGLTGGKGVDVIVNSLAGEALRRSWECISSFGRFVEAGKKDIFDFGKLPMFPFSRGASFSSLDMFYNYHNAPKLVEEVMKSSMALLNDGKVALPSPIHIYKSSQFEEAFRFLESGKSTGKLVIEFNDDEVVPVVSTDDETCKFDPNSTYIISGGLGGIGRSIARWMVGRSARHLILLSRSKAHTEEAAAVLRELRDKGVTVATPPCDIADKQSLQNALRECEGMPPIRGCVQASMVLKDATFANMTLSDFEAAVRPKVYGSWNLHELLPSGMDFFVLLSSMSGIIGSRGQSNYAAGNTYQDALACYRNNLGEKCIALDLGKLLCIGYIAERELDNLKTDSIGRVDEKELFAMLDYACNPALQIQPSTPSQILTGLETSSVIKARGGEEPYYMLRPMFSPLYHMQDNNQLVKPDRVANDSEQCNERIKAAETLEEASEAILNGLQTKLSRTLAVEKENVDTTKPMHIYGVDSLSAVELRTWFRNVVGVEVTVFDILGNQGMADLVTSVAPTSRYLAAGLKWTE